MELIAISVARTVSFLELQGVDPHGQLSLQDGVRLVTEKYGFLRGPQTLAELDLQKGIDFSEGKLGKINIDKLSLFLNGIIVDTRSSTSDCTAVVDDFLAFARSKLGATVRPTRRMHLSNVIFQSDVDLGRYTNPVLEMVAAEVGRSVTHDYGQDVLFSAFSVALSADMSQLGLKPSPFTLERRADTPFSANIYFSAAPINTDLHLDLLARIESAVK